MPITIPDDLRKFLAKPANRKLTMKGSGVSPVTLCAPDELTARMFTIYKRDGFNHERFRGVDLVKACKNYDPEGVRIWFPALKMYGQWDCDHHKINVFPGATWTDIIEDPKPYFDAQWEEPVGIPCRYLKPRPAKPKSKAKPKATKKPKPKNKRS